MDIRKLEGIVIEALEDIKARNIEVITTSGQCALYDAVVIATAESARQTKALARHVQDVVRAAGGEVIGVEGEQTGDWVLVDSGDVVVHIMQPAIRDYYNLEELWLGAPTRHVPGGARPRNIPSGA